MKNEIQIVSQSYLTFVIANRIASLLTIFPEIPLFKQMSPPSFIHSKQILIKKSFFDIKEKTFIF